MKKAIREEYADRGVEDFYKTHANAYENPHFPYIKSLLEKNKNRLDYSSVLDFCAGGGEVALILQDLGYENTTGCDPFTYKLFEKNTSKKCWRFNFEEVVKRKLTAKYTPSVQKPFSSIICSFGMHLCPEKMLQPLVFQLFTLSETLVIITPHKRPALEEIDGVQLSFDDFTLTERGKKVFLKSYEYPSL
jgi:SAM-dependent methyltransferase